MESVLDQIAYDNGALSVGRRTIGTDESDIRTRSSVSHLRAFRQVLDRSFAFFAMELKQRLYTVYRNELL